MPTIHDTLINKMKIIATNIGKKVTLIHNGKEVETGIYKNPVEEPISLGKTDVDHDHVIDRRFHGGVDKACYLYPSEHYSYWHSLFPNVEMGWGAFGENLTTEGLDERTVKIGNVYQIGEALVQVTQPRQPCYKLGIRFNDASMVKSFSKSDFPGIYVRILKEGTVSANDSIELVEEKSDALSLAVVFALLMHREKDEKLVLKALNDEFIAESARRDIRKLFPAI